MKKKDTAVRDLAIGAVVVLIVLVVSISSLISIRADKDNYQKFYSYNDLSEVYDNTVEEYSSLSEEYKQLEEDSLKLQNEYNALVQLFNTMSEENSNYKEALMKAGTSDKIEIDIPPLPKGVVGYVYIPSCDISAFIKEGTTQEAMANMFVGEYENTQNIGEGNYSLFGHSSNTKQLVFSPLKNVKINDAIYIYKDNVIYKFSVGYKFNVDKEDTHILNDTGTDLATCTLVCCSEGGKRRLVVFGNLVNREYYEIEEETE